MPIILRLVLEDSRRRHCYSGGGMDWYTYTFFVQACKLKSLLPPPPPWVWNEARTGK